MTVLSLNSLAHRSMTSLVMPAASWVTLRDHHLMHRVNHWSAPRWLRVWMVASTRGGDGWLWYAMMLVIAIYGGPQRYRALVASFLAVGTGVALFMKLKRVIGRKRPCALEPHCWAKLLPPDQFSFPSGHTITAFAVAVSLGSFYPELRPALLFCATSIALSRVLLGMHFLSDVLAGIVLGGSLGALSVVIVS
ncbi:MAG: phosphatase PAP2 family protein [Acidobacteriota bacterium]